MCVSGGKKCSFFGKFALLCFLETLVLRFAILPYDRRFISGYQSLSIINSLIVVYNSNYRLENYESFSGVSRILLNIQDGAFSENNELVKTITIFTNCAIVDVWQGSKYALNLIGINVIFHLCRILWLEN